MKPKILLIDDEVSILETLEMFFTEKGSQVFKAETCEMGFALYCEHLPDIVIIDIHLPDGDGLEILNRIQNEGHLTKVIMITAYPRHGNHHSSYENLVHLIIFISHWTWIWLMRQPSAPSVFSRLNGKGYYPQKNPRTSNRI